MQNTETQFSGESSAYADQKDLAHHIDEEIEQLRQELDAERDHHLRLAAEYKNYRRRTEQENANAADKGKRELLIDLVSMADDFELAIAGSNDAAETVAEGVRLIHRRFLDILSANNVNTIESEGERFDPEHHEAFDVIAVAAQEPGIVHKEMRRGYLWNSKLLRPALVVVTQ